MATSADRVKCFCIPPGDNVAVLLDDADAGIIDVIGTASESVLMLRQPTQYGHKVALQAIRQGDPIVKYNVPIGHATRDIESGEWVHLHNCASAYDERSSTLDITTGATTDTKYE